MGAALGHSFKPKSVPDFLYHLSWMLHRTSSDFHWPHLLHLFRGTFQCKPFGLTEAYQQWTVTLLCAVLAGVPFPLLTQFRDEQQEHLLRTNPCFGTLLVVLHMFIS